MAESSAAIPRPEGDDADDVAVALETAKALWGIGDKQEAVRWLRRGAEAAEQAGNDLRAVRLARAAADLMSELQPEAAPPSDVPPAPSDSDSPTPLAPSVRPRPPLPAAPAQPAPAGPALTSRPPPPPPSAARAARALATRSMPPPPPAPSAKARSIPPQAAAAATAEPSTPAEASVKSPPETATARAQRSPTPAKARSLPAVERKSPVLSAADSEQGPDVWHALRVSVKASARDPNLFIVRRLGDGKTAAPGTREALIMLLDSNADFLGDKD